MNTLHRQFLELQAKLVTAKLKLIADQGALIAQYSAYQTCLAGCVPCPKE